MTNRGESCGEIKESIPGEDDRCKGPGTLVRWSNRVKTESKEILCQCWLETGHCRVYWFIRNLYLVAALNINLDMSPPFAVQMLWELSIILIKTRLPTSGRSGLTLVSFSTPCRTESKFSGHVSCVSASTSAVHRIQMTSHNKLWVSTQTSRIHGSAITSFCYRNMETLSLICSCKGRKLIQALVLSYAWFLLRIPFTKSQCLSSIPSHSFMKMVR